MCMLERFQHSAGGRGPCLGLLAKIILRTPPQRSYDGLAGSLWPSVEALKIGTGRVALESPFPNFENELEDWAASILAVPAEGWKP